MNSNSGQQDLGFAPVHDQPIAYMRRTREWYLALGYDNPYTWAHYADVPFHALGKPLSEATVTLITTAAPYQEGKGPQGPGAPYNAAAKFYEVYSMPGERDADLRISHVAIDRKHTSMEDARAWFPLAALRTAVQEGRLGRLAARFHGVPTNRSQRHTQSVDCPEILRRCREDRVDAAILVPNCPVCHQTVSLVARHLEAHGIATVIMGCAKDVVEYCGVPRFLFSDFPLGNAAGRPHDAESQRQTLALALQVLQSAPGPRTTVQNPQRWCDDPDWKLDYCNVERVGPDELQALRDEAESARKLARGLREKSLAGKPAPG
ncbi:reductase [Candidimonas humi]|uniref:Glycine/sarcosine/betaine reductase selenoprotein B family protein n=1 Tax=Candidimonas humi TaxID=683355 RepID=A0ABV8P0J4_9BURK|nr:glycine/sarcosine/betaine reductase selenoprotein B family protein [Candidimonas humi]MBV6306948.1 reductase [Candidimonas humi]